MVVRIPVPPAVARLRAQWDPVAALGVPAHITILFPFVPAGRLRPATRAELAEVARGLEPFDVRFSRVGRFPSVVYLAPEPAHPFIGLTGSVAARFPGHLPYGGVFEEVVPHLTICDSVEAPADEIAARAQRCLPFTRRVAALEVLIEAHDAPWRSRWRIPLGLRR